MSKYVDSTEQLVTEIIVKDIQQSTQFYKLLGFHLWEPEHTSYPLPAPEGDGEVWEIGG